MWLTLCNTLHLNCSSKSYTFWKSLTNNKLQKRLHNFLSSFPVVSFYSRPCKISCGKTKTGYAIRTIIVCKMLHVKSYKNLFIDLWFGAYYCIAKQIGCQPPTRADRGDYRSVICAHEPSKRERTPLKFIDDSDKTTTNIWIIVLLHFLLI